VCPQWAAEEEGEEEQEGLLKAGGRRPGRRPEGELPLRRSSATIVRRPTTDSRQILRRPLATVDSIPTSLIFGGFISREIFLN